MKKRNLKNKGRNEKGITLIALVVTIVVLLILAGISISIVLGEGGIIDAARRAGEETNAAIANEQQMLQNVVDWVDNVINGNGGNTPPTEEPKTVADLMGKGKRESNTDVEDEYGNKFTLPAGFTIVPHGTTGVEYNYTGDANHTPSVQDGIVVQDEEENQFVWIPVGTIKNKAGENTLIELKRRVFGENGTVEKETAEGTEFEDEYGNTYLEEAKTENGLSAEYDNSIAKDIDSDTGFKASVTSKGGYYIARYEASYGGPKKPLSKVSEGEPITEDGEEYAPVQIGMLWNNITQAKAAEVARAMYSEDKPYTSDLVNSYAWDTAIYYIQKYSKNPEYSQKKGSSYGEGKLNNTGNEEDKVCNIYDMAGNCWEWSTETHMSSFLPCVRRGDGYLVEDDYTSRRYNYGTYVASNYFSFRVVLYI